MGQIDLKTKDGILHLEYSNQENHSAQWCKIYFVTENEVTYLASKPLEELLSRLLIAFIDIPDRKYFLYKGIQNAFVISYLEASHSTLLGRKTESKTLELFFEGTFGYMMKLVTLTNEDIINWIETISAQLVSELCKLQYEEKGVHIPALPYEIVDTSEEHAWDKYHAWETVYIPKEKVNGKIHNIAWNIKERRHIYVVEIDEKKDFRRYYEDELRKL